MVLISMTPTDEKLFYTKGLEVWKRPVSKPNPDGGKTVSLGFHVCTATEVVGETGAQTIADGMDYAERGGRPDDITLAGELTEIDGQNAMIVMRTGERPCAEHRITGLSRAVLKQCAASLYEPVEFIIRTSRQANPTGAE